MPPLKLFIFLLFVYFKQVLSEELTHTVPDLANCQEFGTTSTTYSNFFSLNYFNNDPADDELFRYIFYVKGDQNLFILFAEDENVGTGQKCYEFGLNTQNNNYNSPGSGSTFVTSVGAQPKVRTEEKIPLSIKEPMKVTIVGKEDGEVQLTVADNRYPLLRFPGNTLQPDVVSFVSRSGYLAYFYFNCMNSTSAEARMTALQISDTEIGPYPNVYVSFEIVSLSRDVSLRQFILGLNYYMVLSHSKETIANSSSLLPKLIMNSDTNSINHAEPNYNVTVDNENNIRTSGFKEVRLPCQELSGYYYCSLQFGLENESYHLTYSPERPLFSSGIGSVADIKVYQAANMKRNSNVTLKSDIVMIFKLAKT